MGFLCSLKRDKSDLAKSISKRERCKRVLTSLYKRSCSDYSDTVHEKTKSGVCLGTYSTSDEPLLIVSQPFCHHSCLEHANTIASPSEPPPVLVENAHHTSQPSQSIPLPKSVTTFSKRVENLSKMYQAKVSKCAELETEALAEAAEIYRLQKDVTDVKIAKTAAEQNAAIEIEHLQRREAYWQNQTITNRDRLDDAQEKSLASVERLEGEVSRWKHAFESKSLAHKTLRRESDAIMVRMDKLDAQIWGLKATCNDLRAENKAQDEEIEQWETEDAFDQLKILELQAEITNLQGRLHVATTRGDTLHIHLKQIEKNVGQEKDVLNADLASAQNSLKVAEDKTEAILADRAAKFDFVDNTKLPKMKIIELRRKLEHTEQALEEAVHNSGEYVHDAEEKQTHLFAEISELKDRNMELEEEATGFREKIMVQEDLTMELREGVTERYLIDHVNGLINENQTLRNGFRKYKRTMSAKNEGLQGKLDKALARIDSLEVLEIMKDANEADWQNKIDEAIEAKDELQDELEAKIDLLKAALPDTNSESDSESASSTEQETSEPVTPAMDVSGTSTESTTNTKITQRYLKALEKREACIETLKEKIKTQDLLLIEQHAKIEDDERHRNWYEPELAVANTWREERDYWRLETANLRKQLEDVVEPGLIAPLADPELPQPTEKEQIWLERMSTAAQASREDGVRNQYDKRSAATSDAESSSAVVMAGTSATFRELMKEKITTERAEYEQRLADQRGAQDNAYASTLFDDEDVVGSETTGETGMEDSTDCFF